MTITNKLKGELERFRAGLAREEEEYNVERLVPPPRRDLGPTEVEEEVLVPGPAARLHGATVEAASVARQTLRSGKKLQFCLRKRF